MSCQFNLHEKSSMESIMVRTRILSNDKRCWENQCHSSWRHMRLIWSTKARCRVRISARGGRISDLPDQEGPVMSRIRLGDSILLCLTFPKAPIPKFFPNMNCPIWTGAWSMVGNWFVDVDKDNLLCNRDCFASNDFTAVSATTRWPWSVAAARIRKDTCWTCSSATDPTAPTYVLYACPSLVLRVFSLSPIGTLFRYCTMCIFVRSVSVLPGLLPYKLKKLDLVFWKIWNCSLAAGRESSSNAKTLLRFWNWI